MLVFLSNFVTNGSNIFSIPSDSTTTYMILSLQGDMTTTNSLLNPIHLEAPFLSLSVAVTEYCSHEYNNECAYL